MNLNTNNYIFFHYADVTEHRTDFLLFICCLSNSAIEVDWEKRSYTYHFEPSGAVEQLRAQTGISVNTIKKIVRDFPAQYCYCNGSFAVLPKHTWERFLKSSAQLNTRTRELTARVFGYFVMQCWNFRHFSRSRELIAQDLGIGINQLRVALVWLTDNQFIAVRHKQMCVPGKPARASVYELYSDEVPPEYLGTFWWSHNITGNVLGSIVRDFAAHFPTTNDKSIDKV